MPSIDFSSPYYQLSVWLLFSLGLWLLSGKLRWRRRWYAWLPGFRYAAFGASVGMEGEGIFLGIMDVFTILFRFVGQEIVNERTAIAIILLELVLYIMQYIYSIRLYLRTINVFGLRKRWILLWLISERLTLLILGLFPRYQPIIAENPNEEWKAGTDPAQLAVSHAAGDRTDSGLSISLRERSVRDFSRKRYLLKDISLNIPNGSLVLLLGGSGSGKTTFVNAITGYEKADADVFLNGSDVYRDYRHVNTVSALCRSRI